MSITNNNNNLIHRTNSVTSPGMEEDECIVHRSISDSQFKTLVHNWQFKQPEYVEELVSPRTETAYLHEESRVSGVTSPELMAYVQDELKNYGIIDKEGAIRKPLIERGYAKDSALRQAPAKEPAHQKKD